MKNNKITASSKIILIGCGLALITVLFAPMWRIELNAPQYPEGLNLLIFANKLGGNVDIINGLNHYIGMQTLHTEDFIEFTLLPYFIIFFVIAFILTGILGKRKWMNLLLILFVSFGIIAMADFWRWEYNYGHNLDPHAAIIVPGMAYQPPLIGYKQLLNFGAYSVPDTGGWVFVGAGLLLLLLVIKEWKRSKKLKAKAIPLKNTAALLLLFTFNSCSSGPQPIITGKDNCTFCKMTISDNRYGAEIVTKKGKVFKFDDSHCLLAHVKEKITEKKDIENIYLTDFSGDHTLVKAEDAFLFQSDSLRGPMNGKITAFSNADSLTKIARHFKGIAVSWQQVEQ